MTTSTSSSYSTQTNKDFFFFPPIWGFVFYFILFFLEISERKQTKALMVHIWTVTNIGDVQC